MKQERRVRLDPGITINQVVGANLRRLREERGLTQAQAGLLLEPYLGSKWKKQTVGFAEKGLRREFSAGELISLARAFGVKVQSLLQPPPGEPTIFTHLFRHPERAHEPPKEGWWEDPDQDPYAWPEEARMTAAELLDLISVGDTRTLFAAHLRAMADELEHQS
jgi:transcriptional regulator with XRE-family HTH domain